MPLVSPITTPLGHSLPPQEHHTITLHAPTWDHAVRFRNKDRSLFAQMVSMYPRFAPWAQASILGKQIHSSLGLAPDQACLPFTHPDTFVAAKEYALSHHRKPEDGILSAGELGFRVVDISGTRLYVVVFPAMKMGGIIGLWQNHGTGISTRLAEDLLASLHENGSEGGIVVNEFQATAEDDLQAAGIPEGTCLPEVEAHTKLKDRIISLLQRESLAPDAAAKLQAHDVYLYPTGMAAIYYFHRLLVEPGPGKVRPGTVVVLGSVFHNSWHVFEEETAEGELKHFGNVSTKEHLDVLEAWLEDEKTRGKGVSYMFVEFPSNPILVSADLVRLKGLVCFLSFFFFYLVKFSCFANG